MCQVEVAQNTDIIVLAGGRNTAMLPFLKAGSLVILLNAFGLDPSPLRELSLAYGLEFGHIVAAPVPPAWLGKCSANETVVNLYNGLVSEFERGDGDGTSSTAWDGDALRCLTYSLEFDTAEVAGLIVQEAEKLCGQVADLGVVDQRR
jgi:hypothetical protein